MLRKAAFVYPSPGMYPFAKKLQQGLILFDYASTDYSFFQQPSLERYRKLVDLLIDAGFLIPAAPIEGMTDGMSHEFDKWLTLTKADEYNPQAWDHFRRMLSISNNAHPLRKVETVPILEAMELETDVSLKDSDVLSLILYKFPIPAHEVRWEKIVEFKVNQDNQGLLSGLKTWINDSLRSEKSIYELNDELEYLIYQYRKAMELHKMEYKESTLETIVVSTAEIIENVARLKLSKAAKIFFKARHDKINLLKAELDAPGREVAYIIKAQEVFK